MITLISSVQKLGMIQQVLHVEIISTTVYTFTINENRPHKHTGTFES